jgi:thioredoxin 1
VRRLARKNFTCFVVLGFVSYAAFTVSALRAASAPTVRIPDAQSAEPVDRSTTGFEPLDRWKDAVLSGDKSALAELYSSMPAASAHLPEGIERNPAVEEPEFWSSLHSKGLLNIAPGVLEQTSPGGAMRLLLHIELTFRSNDLNQRFLIPAVQIWVKQDGDWKILISRREGMAPSPAYALWEPESLNPYLYPDPEEAPSDLRLALTLAAGEHKRVLMVFGANWCYDCHVLDAALHSKDIVPLIRTNFEVVHINIGDGESNAELAERYKISVDRGIPRFAVLDPDGRLIPDQPEEEFPPATQIRTSDLITFLDRWKSSTRPAK